MKLVEVNKEQLNSFVKSQRHAQFLQSWEWGELQDGVGSEVKRLGLKKEGNIISTISLIKKRLPFGFVYYYSPRICTKNLKEEEQEFLFIEIRKLAEEEKVLFLRIEPENELKIKSHGSKIQKTIDVQPSKTVILDLSLSEEELLKSFKQKTRYNIRLAKKKGVKIYFDNAKIDDFWELINTTKTRDQFRIHAKDHYKRMLEIDFVDLVLAEYEGKVVAANIVSCFGDTATYIHGASSNEYRNVMAPHVLQWEIIKKAKERGCRYYDFFGIDERRWPGVTRFKRGFNGEEVNYPGCFDLVFNGGLYNTYRLLRKIRRLV